MSSVLTNNGAMVALQTLKSINSGLGKTQSEISTGKSVATAKDNAAVWAISKVMESDVAGFQSISDSLSVAQSTVGVARQASETVNKLLTQMKTKIVDAQADTSDRAKIQTDIDALKEQITSVVGAAQLNGLNLVDGSTSSMDVLASLDRSSSGVTASSITVNGVDLSVGGYEAADVFGAGTNGTVNAAPSGAGDTFALSIDAAGDGAVTIQNPTSNRTLPDGSIQSGGWLAGDTVSISIGKKTASYTVTADDMTGTTTTADVVAMGLKSSIDKLGITGLTVEYNQANAGELIFNNGGTGAADLAITGSFKNAGSGGLGQLTQVDVNTDPAASLAVIDGLIQTAVDAAASFGSTQGRLDTQADFVSSLTDSLKSGIGSMVDADMEETSARLQALQVQQQLAVQSLSMANQAPQSILSLFR